MGRPEASFSWIVWPSGDAFELWGEKEVGQILSSLGEHGGPYEENERERSGGKSLL